MTPQDLETRLRSTKVVPVLTVKGPEDACRCARRWLPAVWTCWRSRSERRAVSGDRGVTEGPAKCTHRCRHAADRRPCEGSRLRRLAVLVTPGATERLAHALRESGVPALPGAATASEMLLLAEAGFHRQKFFPAEAAGGVDYLKKRAWAASLPEVLPTAALICQRRGPISPYQTSCALAVPGLRRPRVVAKKDWKTITTLAKTARAMTSQVGGHA